ncbi:Uncharacterized protein Fot_46992 [Forsythia ovata]|uniref:F-box associated beta-propeller type 3 domain-containing protein n=1 Tax=Forsythia ovata TaxID=205694 RepID=A0ABD1QP32_9LAMI
MPSCGISLPLRENSLFLEIKDAEFEVRHLKRKFPGTLLDSCRGLLLFYLPDPCEATLCVCNPITMQTEILPAPFEIHRGAFRFCRIVYISQTEEYKVICLYYDNKPLNWDVWTLGIDKEWRRLFAPTYEFEDVLSCVSVGEVVYVALYQSTILAINLFTENTRFLQLPGENFTVPYLLVNMKNSLCFVVKQGANVCIWMLKDWEECELVKVYEMKDIFQGMDIPSDCFFSIGWLENNWLFIFKRMVSNPTQRTILMAYEVNTGKKRCLSVSDGIPSQSFQIHSNTLVTW